MLKGVQNYCFNIQRTYNVKPLVIVLVLQVEVPLGYFKIQIVNKIYLELRKNKTYTYNTL